MQSSPEQPVRVREAHGKRGRGAHGNEPASRRPATAFPGLQTHRPPMHDSPGGPAWAHRAGARGVRGARRLPRRDLRVDVRLLSCPPGPVGKRTEATDRSYRRRRKSQRAIGSARHHTPATALSRLIAWHAGPSQASRARARARARELTHTRARACAQRAPTAPPSFPSPARPSRPHRKRAEPRRKKKSLHRSRFPTR